MKTTADLIIHNGRIATLDPKKSAGRIISP